MARGLITRAVPGTETGSEIALKHSVFHLLPRVSIVFKFNNKYINTPVLGTELAKHRPLWPLWAPSSLGSAINGGTGRLAGDARSVNTCSRTS